MKLAAIKKASLSTGLYRQARFLHRHLNRSAMASYVLDRAFYSQLLPQGGVLCFDVGANIGRIAECLLELGHRVIAFEPQKDCAREIKARCRPYKSRLTVEEVALGHSVGTVPLFLRESSGQTSLLRKWEGKVTGTMQVPVSTLDRAITQYGLPYYCKIDVEGWEVQVLHGLSCAIPLISFEYHQSEGRIQDAFACLDRLSSLSDIRVNITPREQSKLVWASGCAGKS